MNQYLEPGSAVAGLLLWFLKKIIPRLRTTARRRRARRAKTICAHTRFEGRVVTAPLPFAMAYADAVDLARYEVRCSECGSVLLNRRYELTPLERMVIARGGGDGMVAAGESVVFGGVGRHLRAESMLKEVEAS